ncbi:hypothetical protein LPW11_04170 [Geomonas sp. RF6]|uniref:hypothetical protein n=1 Tax=Geomonas sp. RF6 TaxID=2897342 RepID=UPI001E345A4A|nr:hypothetical protein [Geomonas sp. RF6]UFS71395.1 hypothetical protein LPW11_04170 [Geomonas sp. RF6]
MKKARVLAYFMGLAAVLSLWGCGSDNRETSTQPPQVVASQACIGCHNGNTSTVTGNNIFQEWQRSAHASADGGAGCDDCHHVDGHPQNGSIPPLPNSLTCIQCHSNTVAFATQRAHFSNRTASYMGFGLNQINRSLANPVQGQHSNGCNGCHNPHDVTTLLPVNRQFAQSGHGRFTDEAFSEEVFIDRNPCGRCHTGTGNRYYVLNGQRVATAAVLGTYSSALEVVGCNGCHTDYSWQRLSSDTRPANAAAGFTPPTFVTYSTPYVRFPGVSKRFPTGIGDTQLCIPCHGGREGRVGAAVNGLPQNTTTNRTITTDPHYYPAAGTMYAKIGFINFTTLTAPIGTSTYGRSLIASDDGGGLTSFHRQIGTPAITGFDNLPPGKLDSRGPCVTCHMAPGTTAGHTWNITGETFNAVCVNCHTSELGTPLTASNFMSVFVDANRELMQNTLGVAVKLLETKYDITVQLADIEEPQEAAFRVKSTGQAINWTTFTVPGGETEMRRLRGAMFNIMVGYREPNSFLHARTYMRRLLYDSIDWLDDGIINLSAGATAQAVDPAHFTKGATAFTDATLSALAPGTSESMTFLINFSRATGAWAPVERP